MKKLKNIRTAVTSKVNQVIRTDGWVNVLTGLGTTARDKNTSSQLSWNRINRSLAENLFSADDIGGKIAKMIPGDGTREGVTWQVSGDVDNESSNKIISMLDSEFERLQVWEKFNWAWSLARAYGGSIIYMSIDDGEEPDKPLVAERIREIKSLYVIDRWDLDINSGDVISDLSSPDFGTPKFYNYVSASGGFIKIHKSRVIRFDGEKLPSRLFVKNGYWHDSIYQKLSEAIRNYSTGHGNLATILQEVNQPVFKIDGLHDAIAQDEDDLVLKRLQIVNNLRSTLRAVCLDKEDDFSFMQTALGGVSDLMRIITNRLVSASDIPHTRLLGESPGASLGEQGKSEKIDYFDSVKILQESELRDPINKIKEIILNQVDKKVSIPEEITFSFNPLYQQDQKGIIETRKIQADIDNIYMTQGVYDAVEVAENRFGATEYSYETNIEIKEDILVDPKEAGFGLSDPNQDPETQEENDK